MDNTPPEDSIFSMPIWNKGFSDPSANRIQMDPATAMRQGQIKSAVQNIAKGASVAVFMLAIIGGGAVYMLKQTATTTQASIDLKHAILGTVGAVLPASNSFTLMDTKSDDPTITTTNVTAWTVQLPPGVTFTKEATVTLPTCYTISSLDRNLTEALPVSCVNFLQPGAKTVIEYLIVKPENSTIITKKIIREE